MGMSANRKPIHITSAAGAHSADGKFTQRNLAEANPAIKLAVAPVQVPVSDPHLSVRVGPGDSAETSRIEVSSTRKIADMLPDTLDEASKERWIRDHEELIGMYAQLSEVTLNEDFSTGPRSIDVQVRTDQITSKILDGAVTFFPENSWNNYLDNDLGKLIEITGFQGYRAGDRAELRPESVPYQVDGDARELTGNQRSTLLALHENVKGTHFVANSNVYGRCRANWFVKDGRSVEAFITDTGEIDRAFIAPDSWEERPYARRVPYLVNADFVELNKKVLSERVA